MQMRPPVGGWPYFSCHDGVGSALSDQLCTRPVFFRVPSIFFFFSWQFTCAQSSVSWSPADTCMPPAVSPPENVTQGMLLVTFFIILQINFPWLLEWELKTAGGSFKTDLPHIFTDEPWGKSAFPNCFQIDGVAPYGDLGFLLAQIVFSLFWSNCHFDHSKQDKASLRLV